MVRPKKTPGPRGSPLVGNTLQYMRDPLGFLAGVAHEHGDVARLRLAGLDCCLLGHPDDIEAVLRRRHQDYKKDRLTQRLVPLVGYGLLTSEGDFWRRQRKLVQPAFSHRQVERYAGVMVGHTERMLTAWEDGRGRDIHAEMSTLALAIVAETLFAADVEGEAKAVSEALDVLTTYFMSPLSIFPLRGYLPLPSTVRFRRAVRRVDEVLYGIIERRRRSGHDSGDLLGRLLAAQDDEGVGMTDRQLRDEAVTLFLAGHETTALALTYALVLLAGHPDAQERLAAEVDEVLGDRPATTGDVPELRYTGWVVREAMRLYPPAWMIGREALADCEFGGHHVAAGTQLLMAQWVVHRDPRWFDEPEDFRPERWDGELERRLSRGAYFPFGDGPRICIGQHFAMLEAVLVLATVVRRYRLSPASDEPLTLIPSVTLRPRGGVRLVAHERRAAARPASRA
ncbi:cytochrome P450 [Tautonia plasticadhaerens]|uniref:Pentalenene oxygenase n=1 Tax=Tautonia plasticadhaerens TaxID=2527974 RepID=A0A518H6C4_9BACT|nr:cytochrome P450 [Tautonia plasticadhaerens]QDV36390.1 Pentalenene oxygenase [Tautonia plasticadhaerens]